ncbi:OmpA family protein [Actibacterium sp. D379-3]
MRIAPNLIALAAILLAGFLALLSAVVAVNAVERRTEAEIRSALAAEGITWATAEADGVQVHLTGTAPTEAKRFRALAITGGIVDAARVIDDMDVTPSKPVEAPQFTLELLRNDDGVSMIGLIPANGQRAAIAAAVGKAARSVPVTDMLNTADYPAPEGWDAALDYGLAALAMLPRSKISITTDRVAVTAISDSAAQKRKLESDLARKAPSGLIAALEISAPRPVITPFTLRFLIDEGGARFDACSADTPEAATRILTAARAAGLEDKGACTVGLGVPSPNWGRAVETGIRALADLGGGTLTFSDADVTLVALDTTPQALFDKVTGALDSDLPEVFSLHAVLPEPVKVDGSGAGDGPPEFVATKSPEGLVQMRGRVTDDLTRTATESYARARFGLGNVYGGMRLDEELPDGWPLRVLTGLEGLAELNHGSVVVQPEFVELRGVTGDAEANARIAQLFGAKLGDAQNFRIDVSYQEALDPIAALPSPEECVDSLNAILAEQKITFEPGSVTIDGGSLKVVDRIADVLRGCPDVEMEIGGHTDSQGREEMNQQLSQQRADALLNALIARRILTSTLTARGYGESTPIAENDTEEGREANRRIEFRLILPEEESVTEEEAGAAQAEDSAAEGDATAEAEAETGTDSANEQD